MPRFHPHLPLKKNIGLWGTGQSARNAFSTIEAYLNRKISFVTSGDSNLAKNAPFGLTFIDKSDLKELDEFSIIICSESALQIIGDIIGNNICAVDNVFIFANDLVFSLDSKFFLGETGIDSLVVDKGKRIPYLSEDTIFSPIKKPKIIEAPRTDTSIQDPWFIPKRTLEESHLFFPYFRSNNTQRQEEIDTCCIKNIQNPCFSSVTILADGLLTDRVRINLNGCKVIPHSGRLTYKQWFGYVKQVCNRGIALLCNSDIYFDQTVTKLHELFSEYGVSRLFAVISRYDQLGDIAVQHFNPHYSQDAWAVRVENISDNICSHQFDIALGTKRCDSKFAYLLHEARFQLVNPCNFVHSIHLHNSGERNYSNDFNYDNLGANLFVHPMSELFGNSWVELAYYQRSPYTMVGSRIENWF